MLNICLAEVIAVTKSVRRELIVGVAIIDLQLEFLVSQCTSVHSVQVKLHF